MCGGGEGIFSIVLAESLLQNQKFQHLQKIAGVY